MYSQLLYNQDFFIVQMNPRLEIAGFFEVDIFNLQQYIYACLQGRGPY